MESPYPWADALRVWVLGTGGGVLMLTLAIGFFYASDYKEKMREARTEGQRSVIRATTFHVWSIVASYTILIVASMIETYLVIREPIVWHKGPFYAVAYPLAVYALWTILRVVRKRKW